MGKDAPYHMPSDKWKLKHNTTAYLLQWPKSRALITLNAGEDVEQQELSFVAGGNENGADTLEDNWAVSYKTKHALNIKSSNYALWYLPKRDENLHPQKNLHMDIDRSLLIIAKTWGEQGRCPSVGEWISSGPFS